MRCEASASQRAATEAAGRRWGGAKGVHGYADSPQLKFYARGHFSYARLFTFRRCKAPGNLVPDPGLISRVVFVRQQTFSSLLGRRLTQLQSRRSSHMELLTLPRLPLIFGN